MPNTMFFTPQGNAIHAPRGRQSRTPGFPWLRSPGLAERDDLFNLVQSQGMYGAQVVITGPSPACRPAW